MKKATILTIFCLFILLSSGCVTDPPTYYFDFDEYYTTEAEPKTIKSLLMKSTPLMTEKFKISHSSLKDWRIENRFKRLDFRLEFERDMLEYLNELNLKKPIIYAGDLNVAHNEIDIKNPKGNERNAGFTIEERTAFTKLLNNGYTDIYRHLNPTKVKYSWWSYMRAAREKNIGWRLDYFIVDKDNIKRVIDSKILDTVMGSDHCPIELDVL